MNKKVCLIIPAFNEEGNIRMIAAAVEAAFKPLPYDHYIIFVDDGSTDGTLAVIQQLCAENDRTRYISFSRNHGHQVALKAGIDHSDADCSITMDSDLQHPADLLPVMLNKWEQGYEVVYSIRTEQGQLPFFKKISSTLFYKLLSKLSNIELENGSADFRLLDKKVTYQLKQITENDIFLRGLVKWMGFKQVAVSYKAGTRYSGNSKYSYKKMMLLALQGITSFSTKPLYIAIYIGFAFSLLSLLYIPYAIYSYWLGHVVSGWASLIVTVTFLGGLQLIILGIIGLYLGKLFMQSKGRPLYIVDQTNLQ